MYNKVNITENHLQVLSLFTDGFDRSLYIREVQRALKISPRTAQTILANLEGRGIIESKRRGKIVSYSLKRNEICRRFLVFCEQYKAISFLSENLMINEIIEKVTPQIEGIGIIFGSYAKGINKPESDLDMFVIGKYNQKGIDKVSQMYGIDISVKCYPLGIFRKDLHRDILTKEVLKSHVVFLNSEAFVKEVLSNG